MRLYLLAAIGAALLASPLPALAGWASTCTRDPYSSVNLRRGPSTRDSVVASVPNGRDVRLLSWVWGSDGMRWFRVETGGLVGYARSDYLCR
jgi:uncharacterized protein YraI